MFSYIFIYTTLSYKRKNNVRIVYRVYKLIMRYEMYKNVHNIKVKLSSSVFSTFCDSFQIKKM